MQQKTTTGSPTEERRQQLVEQALPLVKILANKMVGAMHSSIRVEDLINSGVLGAIDAASRFDESRGLKFETFAQLRIHGAMVDALRKDSWPVRVRRLRNQILTARQKLRDQLHEEPSLSQVAEYLGKDQDDLTQDIVRINTIETTAPCAKPKASQVCLLPAGFLPAKAATPEELYSNQEMSRRLRNTLAVMRDRDRQVLRMYYYEERNHKEIAQVLGVTEARISQLRSRAVRRLRSAFGSC